MLDGSKNMYADLGDDPVFSIYGYPGFDEVSVVILIGRWPYMECEALWTDICWR